MTNVTKNFCSNFVNGSGNRLRNSQLEKQNFIPLVIPNTKMVMENLIANSKVRFSGDVQGDDEKIILTQQNKIFDWENLLYNETGNKNQIQVQPYNFLLGVQLLDDSRKVLWIRLQVIVSGQYKYGVGTLYKGWV